MTQYVQVTLSPELSVTSQEGHILENLATGSLISIGNSVMTILLPSSPNIMLKPSNTETSLS